MEIPILKGSRVTLRKVKPSDAPKYVRWFSDKEIMMYFGHEYYKINLKDEEKFLRSYCVKPKRQYIYAIIDENGKHIGGTGLKVKRNKKRVEWGIIIGEKSSWGQGYAGECARLCLDFAFKKLKAERVDLYVVMKNEKAIKAYKKIGFVHEGIMRKAKLNEITGKMEDMGIMSILKNEWKNK